MPVFQLRTDVCYGCAVLFQCYTTHEYYSNMLHSCFLCLIFFFIFARWQLTSILTLGQIFPRGEYHCSYSLCIRNCLRGLHTHSVESQLGGISILGERPLLMKLSVTCASNTTLLTDTALQPQWASGRAALCFPVSSAYVRTAFKARAGNCVTRHHMAAPTLTVSYKFLNNKRW